MLQALISLLRNAKGKEVNAAMASTINQCLATDWLEEDQLMLLECWARDGYTFEDIANRIGIGSTTLKSWRKKYPEIDNALKKGREIIDYKVENALLKSALGYKTKEVKVTTIMRNGRVVETQTETLNKEQAPNVSAIQCWLYNRLPKKWKNMNSRANIFDDMDEDTSIHVTVTRASGNNKTNIDNEDDKEWQQEVNSSIEIRNATEEEKRVAKQNRKNEQEKVSMNRSTKIEHEASDDDLDYWPDDWEDNEE